MLSCHFSTFVLATSALAQTFTEFTPGTTNALVAEFVGNASGSAFVSSAVNLPADRVSAPPFVGLTGDASGKFVLMMVDTDALPAGATNKTTIMHYFQTDLNLTSTGTNYTRLSAPSNIPAFKSYLAPGPPAGQIHRYSLLLFPQPVSLTIDVVSAAFTAAFKASGVDRVGFDIAMFQSMTAIAAPVAATYFEFGEGTLTVGAGENLKG